MNIQITRNTNPPAPPTGNYGFGQIFTPHMFMMDYSEGNWHDPRIVPSAPLTLHPAAKVLHYGQEVFEGMKAYRNGSDGSVHMFRPDKNVRRFNISNERMSMPLIDESLFMEALERLVDIDRDWVPEVPDALYIRPTIIATQPALGVRASNTYLFYIILSPVGSYFAGGINPLRLRAEEKYVRSTPGGTGFAKTGGNYAAALLPIKLATDDGFDQIIWLDSREMKYVEEMGAMNIAFVYEDRIITAATGDTILDGVTRNSVGHLCKDFNLNWVEERPEIAQVCEDADTGKLKEVFACGTAAVITPVGVINHAGKDHKIGDGREGAITRQLRESLTELHEGASELHPQWIHVVPNFD